MILAIVLFVASFVLSICLTAITRSLCSRRGFVAHPRVDRFHSRTVAMGGGIAIFACLFIFSVTTVLIAKFFAETGRADFLDESITIHIPGLMSKIPELIIVIGCTAVLFALGLWDDKKHLSPATKLIVQFVVAFAAAFFADVRVELFIANKLLTSLLSTFWIVFIINAFNFLDNMDGAAAGIAAIIASILFIAAALSGQVLISGFALVFIATLGGFIVFNFCPASIFMGDAGSFVIGFLIAFLTLRTTYYQQTESAAWYAVLMPLVIMAIPLYDFLSVTTLRIIQGKSPFVGDTQHFSHRLSKRGLTETQAVLTLYLATLCTGLGALVLRQATVTFAIIIFLQTVMILAIIAVLETTGNNVNTDR